jgi:hypothetical protein
MGMALGFYDVASRAVLRALFDFPDDGGLEFAAVSELQEQFAIGHAETNWITRRKVSRSVSDAIPVVATCINEGMAFHSQKGRRCIARRCQQFSNFRFGLGPNPRSHGHQSGHAPPKVHALAAQSLAVPRPRS